MKLAGKPYVAPPLIVTVRVEGTSLPTIRSVTAPSVTSAVLVARE